MHVKVYVDILKTKDDFMRQLQLLLKEEIVCTTFMDHHFFKDVAGIYAEMDIESALKLPREIPIRRVIIEALRALTDDDATTGTENFTNSDAIGFVEIFYHWSYRSGLGGLASLKKRVFVTGSTLKGATDLFGKMTQKTIGEPALSK